MPTNVSPASAKSSVFCTTCGKRFERNDHLRRHMDSHRDRRSFKCFHCGKAYNRRDLLTRHYTVHEAAAGNGSRRAARADKACRSCATSKVKCDNERPCKRCLLAGRLCANSEPSGSAESPSSQTQEVSYPSSEQLYPNSFLQTDLSDGLAHLEQPQADGQAKLDEPYNSFDYPMYFEHIMMPDLLPVYDGMETGQPSLDLGAKPSFDVPFDAMADLDFSAMFDTERSFQDRQQGEQNELTPVRAVSPDLPRARLEAFQRSPWLWMPSEDQSAFNEQSRFAIDATSEDLAASPETLSTQESVLQDVLSSQARDSILLLIKSTSKDRIAISNFPGPDILTTLIRTCILKRMRTDVWLHSATFKCRLARTELLAALIAGGCICFGIRDIARTGLLLQEVVRMSLERLFEADNSVLRDLQYLQAYMLWIDMGITCGIKRKMDIAESRFQPLCTALRRADAYENTMYEHIAPFPQDGDDELHRKWLAWVQQESLKRLAYYALEHDAKVALLFNRPPLMSYAEITAPLPLSMDLWLARSATEWRHVYFALQDDCDPTLTLRDLLTRPEAILLLAKLTDAPRTRSLLLSGLAGQVWELKQQMLTTSAEDASATLWLRSRRSNLGKQIETIYQNQQESSPAERMYQQYLLMCLYVSIDDLQRFAGKNGDNEARKAYRRLEPWSHGKDGRHAIWHAGQILRAGRSVAPYQFRGFDSITIYHATLVLWVYGVLRSAEGRHKAHVHSTHSRGPLALPEDLRDATPTPRSGAGVELDPDSTPVFLDAQEANAVLFFKELGKGLPGIHLSVVGDNQSEKGQDEAAFCDLRKSNLVMAIGSHILEQNYPDVPKVTPGRLPPLIENLRDLMKELGRLPGHTEMTSR